MAKLTYKKTQSVCVASEFSTETKEMSLAAMENLTFLTTDRKELESSQNEPNHCLEIAKYQSETKN